MWRKETYLKMKEAMGLVLRWDKDDWDAERWDGCGECPDIQRRFIYQ